MNYVGASALSAAIDYVKTLGLALLHFGLLSARIKPALSLLSKLAMADIFLIAVYITVAKGIGVGRIETAWGLYLFTGCILVQLFLGLLSNNRS